MKRELFSLAVEGIKGKKRSSILLMLVLVLSFAFAVITLSVTGSMNKTNEEYRYDTYGTWHGAIPKGKEEDAEFLKKNQFVEEIGSSRFYGKIAKGTSGIGTIDETFKKLGRINLQDGRFPENADEIAMEADVLSVLGYNYELGQKISLMVSVPVYPLSGKEVNFIPEILVEQEYTLCGVLKEYTDLWLLENSSQILEGAVITEAGAENLIRDAKILAKEKKVSLKGTIPHYFFTLKEGKEMQFRGEVHQWLMKTRQEPGDEKEISLNPSAVTDSQQMVYHYFYLGMILVTTLLAVVCIYMVQLQKQVRQIALFRSIGVTRGQLGRILFYETVCISIPAALLGVLTGILGTVGVLQVLFGVSKAKVYVQVPATALLFMIVIWVFGIFAVRLLVFGIALRQPLTGQIRMGYKKNGRYRRIKRLMVFGLAGVFCGVFFFGILQSIPQIEDKRKWEQNSSYNLYSENALATLNNDTAQQVITEEMIEQMEQVPGVLLVNAYGRMFVEMKFPGMENCAFSAMYLDEEIWREKIAYPGLETEITEEGEKEIPFPEGAGVELYGIREKNWPEYFDSKKLGIDEEAFRNGEEVIVSVPVDMNGNVTYRYETYDSCGLKKGDTIELGLYGNQMNGMNMSPKKE